MAIGLQDRVGRAFTTGWLGQYHIPMIVASCTALVVTPIVWRRLTYEPELLPPPPGDFQYRLPTIAKAGSDVFTLPGGRTIGYSQYGYPRGKPIICLHGMPGSRLENALMHDTAEELGVRIIGIDRPGIGQSSPDTKLIEERKIVDHAKDVEALAEHLGLKEYAVLGISGGGPYALGCAATLPSSSSKPQLKAVATVTGLGLPDMSQAWPAPMVWLNQRLDLRWLIKKLIVGGPLFNMQKSDDERMEILRQVYDLKKDHPANRETARRANYPDMQRLFIVSSREALSQGLQGLADDARVLSRNPGFRVEDIPKDLPVQIWCGTDDTNVSPKAGEETAQRLRSSGNTKVELHMMPGETHGSVQVKFRKDYLRALLEAMSREGRGRSV